MGIYEFILFEQNTEKTLNTKAKYTSVSPDIFTGNSLQSLSIRHSTAPLMKPPLIPLSKIGDISSSNSSSHSSSNNNTNNPNNNIIMDNQDPHHNPTSQTSMTLPSVVHRRRSSTRKSIIKTQIGATNTLVQVEGGTKEEEKENEEEEEEEPESDLDEDEMIEKKEEIKEEENKEKYKDYQLDYPKLVGGILPTVNASELLEAERCDFYEGSIAYIRQQKIRVERCEWPLVFYRIFNPHIRDPQVRELCLPMVEDGVKYLLGPEKHRHFTYLSKHLFTVDALTRAQNLERKRSILTGTPESDASDDALLGYSQQGGWSGGFRSYPNNPYLSRNDLDSVG